MPFPGRRRLPSAPGGSRFLRGPHDLVPAPDPLPGDILGGLETFAKAFLVAVDANERTSVLTEVRDRLAPQLSDDAGRWSADYVRLRFLALKP